MQPPPIGRKLTITPLSITSPTDEQKSVETRTEHVFEPSKADMEDKLRTEADLLLISRIKSTVRGLLEELFKKYEPVKEAGLLSMTEYLTYIAYIALTLNHQPTFRQIFAFVNYSQRESYQYSFTNETINFYINEMKTGLGPEEKHVLDVVSQLSRMKVLKKHKVGYFCDCSTFKSDPDLHKLVKKLVNDDVKLFDVKFKDYIPKKILALSLELKIPISKISVREWISHALLSIIHEENNVSSHIKKCFLGIIHSIYYHSSDLFVQKDINTFAEYFKTLQERFSVLKAAYPQSERVLDQLEHIARSVKRLHTSTLESCSVINPTLMPSRYLLQTKDNNKCRPFDFPARDFFKMQNRILFWSYETIAPLFKTTLLPGIVELNTSLCTSRVYFELSTYSSKKLQTSVSCFLPVSYINNILNANKVRFLDLQKDITEFLQVYEQLFERLRLMSELHKNNPRPNSAARALFIHFLRVLYAFDPQNLLVKIQTTIRDICFHTYPIVVYTDEYEEIISANLKGINIEKEFAIITEKLNNSEMLKDAYNHITQHSLDPYLSAEHYEIEKSDNHFISKLLNVSRQLIGLTLANNGIFNCVKDAFQKFRPVFDDQIVFTEDYQGLLETIDLDLYPVPREELFKMHRSYEYTAQSTKLSKCEVFFQEATPRKQLEPKYYITEIDKNDLRKIENFGNEVRKLKTKSFSPNITSQLHIFPSLLTEIIKTHFYIHTKCQERDEKKSVSETGTIQSYDAQREVNDNVYLLFSRLSVMIRLLEEADYLSFLALVPSTFTSFHLIEEQFRKAGISLYDVSLHTHNLVDLYLDTDLWIKSPQNIRDFITTNRISSVYHRSPYVFSSALDSELDHPLVFILEALLLLEASESDFGPGQYKRLRNVAVNVLKQYILSIDLLDKRLSSVYKWQGQNLFVYIKEYLSNGVKWVENNIHEKNTKSAGSPEKLKNTKAYRQNQILTRMRNPEAQTKAECKVSEEREMLIFTRLNLFASLDKIHELLETYDFSVFTKKVNISLLLKDVQGHYVRIEKCLSLLETRTNPIEALPLIKELYNMQWIIENLYQCRILLKNDQLFFTHQHDLLAFFQFFETEDASLLEQLKVYNFAEGATYIRGNEHANPFVHRFQDAIDLVKENGLEELKVEIKTLVAGLVKGLDLCDKLLDKTIDDFKLWRLRPPSA